MSRPELATPIARVAADLLRAGRVFFGLSLILSGAAVLGLVVGVPDSRAATVRLLLGAVLLFGLLACWFAFRIGFDAAIFARFGRSPEAGGIAPDDFDDILAGSGLAPGLRKGRPMEARLRGAVRLLLAQMICLIGQVICLLGFAASPWLRLT